MATGKKRTDQQMMESESLTIIEKLLPREWVIHDYSPDYGIDFVVELFERESPESPTCVSLGEVLFVQAKSVKRAVPVRKTIEARYNVSMAPYKKTGEGESVEVIPFALDTALLNTVHAMGPSLPVMLLVVSLEDETIYFLCLNDYIDKILVPEHATWKGQEHVTLFIPVTNKITTRGEGFEPFQIYSQRPKLYAAFNLFSYQLASFQHNPLPETLKHFLDQALSYDFWHRRITFNAIHDCYESLLDIAPIAESKTWIEDESARYQVIATWSRLVNLAHLLQEVWREYYLPTHLGISL